ncbi:MAG: fumarylacetoacetate hydrolase family protein [Candidatus Eisenbacteria bacterium]|nr:fumarylacetoacetate hydrolase family protein [Candidatus Eisenbacteria bacterium]
MRAVSFGEVGKERPGVVEGERLVAVETLDASWPRSWKRLLGAGLESEVFARARRALDQGSVIALSSIRLGPPIPDPSKIIAIGLNYRDHALEQKKEPPLVPLLFAKAPSCLVGPHDPIRLPDQEPQVDAEAELCLVIGRTASRVSETEALDHVFGWTVMNDVSGRAAQYGDKQWFRGKSFDSFGPSGPWIVRRADLADPTGLALEADWGSTPMQRGNTRDLIHGPAALVSYVSHQMTLFPGDLISTGTPAGVGVFREPPAFLERGMLVTVRLEGVGELRNPVI